MNLTWSFCTVLEVKGKMAEQTTSFIWQRLEGKIPSTILCAPKTGGDLEGRWPPVHERITKYLERNVIGEPWADHVTLAATVMTARRRDVRTVELTVQTLHLRFRALFQAFELKTMDDWLPDVHIPAYLKAEVLPDDSSYLRLSFWKKYVNTVRHVWNWLDTLPEVEKQAYQRFVLPPVNTAYVEGILNPDEVNHQRKQKRKNETEAVVPQFSALRAEAHFRYNKLARLRKAYQTALQQCLRENIPLPHSFSYEEGEPAQERLSCRIWDRRSFVIAHAESYAPRSVRDAHSGTNQFADERNNTFLEFVKAEPLMGDAPPEGFWFTELLNLRLLGHGPRSGEKEEIASRQAWLQKWGYGEGRPGELAVPFDAHAPGLLSWSDGSRKGGGIGLFMSETQKRAEGVLVPVEALYAAAMFGLLAIDTLTSTGLRINELMQLRLSRDCIVQLEENAPVGAKDRSPRIRYLFRLLPKGERTDTLYNYGIGKETIRLVEKVGKMLFEHYCLRPGEALPRVVFDPLHGRSHRFGAESYLFQYNRKHLSDETISACMRFLIHGMVFESRSGKPVVLKPHLLRHSFATYAVQVEQMPLDLVAEWLKQKNLEVTKYYSEMPAYMQAEERDAFLSRMAIHINVREAIIRSPEEIRKQGEEARRRTGTLAPVAGGDCTLHAFCPNQYSCIGCPAKAPDPEKRSQVMEKQRWAKEQLQYYTEEGLVLEAERMKRLLRDCEIELKEMDLMVAYRKDEQRVPIIKIEARKRH